METYFLKSEDAFKFYESINKDYDLFVPVRIPSKKIKCEFGFDLAADDYILKRYSQALKKDITFNEYRPVEPVRTYFTHYKEEVVEFFHEGAESKKRERAAALFGVKSCDLFSLKIQDYVFLGGDEPDPVYKSRRESILLIASDCTAFKEACFCRAFQIDPFANEGFDINLSPLNNGYLVDVATKKGQAAVQELKNVFTQATLGQLSGREAKREAVAKRLDEHLSYHKIPGKDVLREIVTAGFNSPVWNEQMKTCVECGGCVLMCDTCHCFLLSDEKRGELNTKRMRLWDGCLFKNFTRVAGGANALRMRYMRLRNRFMKKFDFFIENMGIQGCCGCGRCIDVCPGKIDIRGILKRLNDEKYIPAA